jgi:hypothetical protein
MPKTGVLRSRDNHWGRRVAAFVQVLSVCAEGCYKHFKAGKWVCCKCGE